MRRALLALVLLSLSMSAVAHRASDAFVTLVATEGGVTGQWEIALRDLEAAFAIDADRNRALTWGELLAARPRLETRLPAYLNLSNAAGPCALRIVDLMVNQRVDGAYAWLSLRGECPGLQQLQYRFLHDVDPGHRAIVSLTDAGGQVHSAVLSPDHDSLRAASDGGSRWQQFASYVREGTTHIWGGYDHILFLLTLLLPCVLVRSGRRWQPAPAAGPAAREVVIIVTAFTVAHSITLSLSALDLLRLPMRWVEAGIAFTVMLAALNNLWPVVQRRAAVAFGFGLIHGFGFASALGELGLPAGARVLGLAGFNIGVELGQLAIVAVAMPLFFALRRTRIYEPGILYAGSLGIVALAAYWFIQRAVLNA